MIEDDHSKLTPLAQTLRKKMTSEERHLWYDFLKSLPVTVNRQKVVGPYIADFYCASAGIVIELDGSQHFEKEGQRSDKIRDAYFAGLGIRVLRYSNEQIHRSFTAVCEDILQYLKDFV